MKSLALLTFTVITKLIISQGSYAPDASTIGTDAMQKDSSAFVGWATNCSVTRGFQNINDQSLGYASAGMEDNATGKAGLKGIVSLGDKGEAILTFNQPIINGNGPDFAVFENGFNHTFLELAFVEVSTDGVNYVRFPSHSETQNTNQIDGFGNLEASNLYNLAGKYKANYGTPFDLEELTDSSNIDINNINFIKIIDVIGIINNSNTSFDNSGNQINDPFPTPYPSSGFDLDAVGVIHQFVGIKEAVKLNPILFPNPSNGQFSIALKNLKGQAEITIYNLSGVLVSKSRITDKHYKHNQLLPAGIYIIQIKNENTINKQRLIVR